MASSGSEESRKVYSREDLFRLAGSMTDPTIDREQLNKFKETKLIYNLEQLAADDLDNCITVRPKLSRTVSNQQSFERNYQRVPPPRLSRMTSSPSLKYNRNHHEDRAMMLKGDSISSQVKAKYAELIDNLTSSSAAAAAAAPGTRRGQPVGRSASLNHWQTETEQARRAIERPSTIFGPLRREINRHNHQNRRDSEEPLSLPYFSTNNSASGKLAAGRSAIDQDQDDFSSSPIKRIGSFGNSANNKENSNNADTEEDDFDLNSMINITVLSDIKTIRQDFQQQQHQQQSSSLPQQQQNSAGRAKQTPKHRDYSRQQNSQDQRSMSMRPLLTRSRTATEFNYRGRYGQQQSPLQPTSRSAARMPAHMDRTMSSLDSSTVSYQPTGYDSIPCTYGWQFDEQRLNRTGQSVNKPTGDSSLSKASQNEPKDEKSKKIIEAFKAQVLARAASSDLPAEAKVPEQKLEVRNDGTENSSSCKEQTKIEKANVSDDRPAATTTKDTSGEKGQVEIKTEEKAAAKPKETDSSQKSSKPALVSNIPRLISLHSKQAAKPPEESPDSAKTTTIETKTPQHRPITKSTSVSSKFVSQYRQLRGKSLADEMGDASSKK